MREGGGAAGFLTTAAGFAVDGVAGEERAGGFDDAGGDTVIAGEGGGEATGSAEFAAGGATTLTVAASVCGRSAATA